MTQRARKFRRKAILTSLFVAGSALVAGSEANASMTILAVDKDIGWGGTNPQLSFEIRPLNSVRMQFNAWAGPTATFSKQARSIQLIPVINYTKRPTVLLKSGLAADDWTLRRLDAGAVWGAPGSASTTNFSGPPPRKPVGMASGREHHRIQLGRWRRLEPKVLGVQVR
jgi:hypothetical protein